MNVVICDDHVVFAESLAHLLHARGINVVGVVFDPRDAARVLAKTDVDVCVLDVTYGVANVINYLPTVRAASPNTNLMILTGSLSSDLIKAGLDEGVLGFAEKRQTPTQIMSAIQQVAGGHKVIPRDIDVIRPTPASNRAASAQTLGRLAAFLTPREREVLSALVGGLDTVGVAKSLGITQATARSHVQSMMIKLNVHSRLEAATMAVRSGLLDPETGEWLV